MLIRPLRQATELPPIPLKAASWFLYRCDCCGAVRRRLVDRGELADKTVTGYCPKSRRSEIMRLA